MYREQTVTVTFGTRTKTFIVNNRMATSQGEAFLTDAEFDALVAEQTAAAKAALKREIEEEQREARLAALRTKVKDRIATLAEVMEYLVLRDNL